MTSQPRITVIGVGGAGGNAVSNMIRSNLEGVEFLVCNTDAQALNLCAAEHRIQLGLNATRGLGAGSRPDIGRAAAEEAADEMMNYLDGSNMVFITAGMGGGTGTGAAPVIARAARERNILTVGVVTKPFQFEGAHRMKTAEAGIQELQQYVDTLIVIPNQNLFRIANEKTTFADAFKMADEVLHSGVRGITDLIVMPGLINLDFADIRTVMSEMGKAMMGTGEAAGERRAIEAAEAAISNPLLDEVSLKGAKAMLVNITAGPDVALFEVDEVVNRVRAEVDPDANVIFGSTFDPNMEGRLRVSVVATGIDANTPSSGMSIAPASQRYRSRLEPVPEAPVELSPIEAALEALVAPVAKPEPLASVDAAPEQSSASEPEPEPDLPPRPKIEIVQGGVSADPVRPVSPYALGASSDAPISSAGMQSASDPTPIDMPSGLSGRPEVERVPGSMAVSPQQAPLIASSPAPIFGQASASRFASMQAPQHPLSAPEIEGKRSFSLFERLTGAAKRAEKDDSDQ